MAMAIKFKVEWNNNIKIDKARYFYGKGLYFV